METPLLFDEDSDLLLDKEFENTPEHKEQLAREQVASTMFLAIFCMLTMMGVDSGLVPSCLVNISAEMNMSFSEQGLLGGRTYPLSPLSPLSHLSSLLNHIS